MSVYPGFSWSLTQHIGPATEKATMAAFLRAAYTHSDESNPGDSITESLISSGILTENIREDAGRAQTWRDYQQVLSELGFIVSTRFTQHIVVTPVGLMLLDGMLGYSELITTQCLRYQYPNGHKQDISASLKEELEGASITIPQTRTELDTKFGIKIRPAVLILRILIELFRENETTVGLTVEQCVKYLIPTQTNSSWEEALQRIKDNSPTTDVDTRRKRHIQEWFRLLGITDLFENQGNTIYIKSNQLTNIDGLTQLCEKYENQDTFWSTQDFEKSEMALSWFNYFGNPPLEQQWTLPLAEQTEAYIQENYSEGVNLEEIPSSDESTSRVWDSQISLREFIPSTN